MPEALQHPVSPEPTLDTPGATRPSSEIALLLTRFRLRAQRRALWLQTLWAEEGDSGGSHVITHAELASILADRDAPSEESAWQARHSAAQILGAELILIEEALRHAPASRLTQLAQIFGWSDADRDLFEACAAVALDPALARVCAYLQDDAECAAMSETLAARLYGHGRCGLWSAESPLFRWEFLAGHDASSAKARLLRCDPQIRDWLLERAALTEVLTGVAHLHEPLSPLPSWPVAATAADLSRMLSLPGTRLRVLLTGPRGTGRKTFAAAVAKELGLPLLVLDADPVEEASWRKVFLHAQRQAFLDRCALGWAGESLARRAWPQTVVDFPLQFVFLESATEVPPVAGLIDRRIVLPPLAIEERAALWRAQLPAAATWPESSLALLSARHRVHPGDVALAARLGVQTPEEAESVIRQGARARLGPLAQPLETPFTSEDLVLAPFTRKALDAIAFEAEHRSHFWEKPEARRLFPQGRGLLALFSGPPGTGKTMAAQVIASRLSQDLFRVNVAQVVSKWVGETAKHFDFILTQAADMDAVLFFDEADALFAKRSSEVRDAQDKFANTDAAFLLQAIENYPGVALLASNLKGNIDPAFFRRLRHVVEFAKPDAALQRTLWEKFVGELAGVSVLTVLQPSIDALSIGLEATGAQIKYAVLSALFLARQEKAELAGRHLLLGLEREIGKEGRAIGPRDRERILHHG